MPSCSICFGIGRDILVRQAEQGWRAKVIDRLSHDLLEVFPEMKGFSTRNLKYMHAFAQAWPDAESLQEVLARLTWHHQIALLEKLEGPDERSWYSLRDNSRPLGIAEYRLVEVLPEPLETNLPTVEQIERELEGESS